MTNTFLFLIAGLLTLLNIGCVTEAKVPPADLTMIYIQTKIPLRVISIFPDSFQQYECKIVREPREWRFDCGKALTAAITGSLEKLFIDVKSVTDMAQVTQTNTAWDRLLWFELDQFEVWSNFWSGGQGARISIKYKFTDRNNKTTFSSIINVENVVHAIKLQEEFPLLAFNGPDYRLENNTDHLRYAASTIFVPTIIGAGEPAHPEQWIADAIKKILPRLIKEIMDAYGEGKI